MNEKKLQKLTDEAKIVGLKLKGYSLREIAVYLHKPYKTVQRLFNSAIKKELSRTDSKREMLIEVDVQRLEALIKAVYEKALKGEYKAIEAVLKIMERKARLLGLDQQIEHTVNNFNGICLLPPEDPISKPIFVNSEIIHESDNTSKNLQPEN